jgi:hypothetical protein
VRFNFDKGMNFLKIKMKKYYYKDVLANQNIRAKPNIAWTAAITSIEL